MNIIVLNDLYLSFTRKFIVQKFVIACLQVKESNFPNRTIPSVGKCRTDFVRYTIILYETWKY